MIVTIVLAVYFLYAVFDLLPTLRARQAKYIWPCLIFFCIGLVVQVLHEYQVPVPSPAVPITKFFTGWFNIS